MSNTNSLVDFWASQGVYCGHSSKLKPNDPGWFILCRKEDHGDGFLFFGRQEGRWVKSYYTPNDAWVMSARGVCHYNSSYHSFIQVQHPEKEYAQCVTSADVVAVAIKKYDQAKSKVAPAEMAEDDCIANLKEVKSRLHHAERLAINARDGVSLAEAYAVIPDLEQEVQLAEYALRKARQTLMYAEYEVPHTRGYLEEMSKYPPSKVQIGSSPAPTLDEVLDAYKTFKLDSKVKAPKVKVVPVVHCSTRFDRIK